MKRCTFILTLFLLSKFSLAQTDRNKWSAGCMFGIHFAQGDFGAAVPDDIKAGYAVTGYRLSLPLTYFLWKNTGVSAVLFSQKHDIDKDRILHQLVLSPENVLKSCPWSFEGFLAGPSASLAADEQGVATFNIKVMGGLIRAELPVLGKYIYYYDPAISGKYYYLVTTGQSSDIALAFLIDTETQVKLGKNIALAVGVSYFSAEPEFKNVPVTVRGNTVSSTYRQPVRTLGLDCGLVYLMK